MYIHDATEQAYKNGYASAVEDIRVKACPMCDGTYNQEFMIFHVRRHNSSDTEIMEMKPLFCPNCGRSFA